MRSPFINAETFRSFPDEKQEAFLQWLREEGLPVDNIYAVTFCGDFVIATEYTRNSEGQRFVLAGTHQVAMHEQRYPISSPPPEIAPEGQSAFWEVEPKTA